MDLKNPEYHINNNKYLEKSTEYPLHINISNRIETLKLCKTYINT